MKILIGPLLPDNQKRINDLVTLQEIAGNSTNDYDLKFFNLKYQIGAKTYFIHDFQEILANLPLNWKPDLLIFWRPEYEYLPLNIEKVNFPIVAVVGDWYLGLDHVLLSRHLFDHIFTDFQGLEILQNNGYDQCSYFPMWGYDPTLHKFSEKEKKIDISFVGKLNHETHHERSKWLYRLTQLSEKYRVAIISGVFREDYVEILNQSKITFNYAIKHELNMRSYEALACKSLLFNESENLESRALLEDKKDCIYYDEDNFEELISYYLENEIERNEIINSGYQAVYPETYENHFRFLLEKCKEIRYSPKETLTLNLYFRERVRTVSLNFFTKEDIRDYLNSVLLLFSQNKEDDSCFFNNRAVALAELNNFIEPVSEKMINFRQIQENLLKAQENAPEQIVVIYNLGLTNLLNGKFIEAEHYFCHLLVMADKKTSLDLNFLFYKNNSDQFNREFNQVILNYHSPEKFFFAYRNLILWKTREYLGYLQEIKGNFKQALWEYDQAVILKPQIGTTRYRLAKLQFRLNYLTDSLANFQKIFADEPFFIPNWFSLLDSLQILGKEKDKINYIKKFINVINSLDSLNNQDTSLLISLRKRIYSYY